jgi:hypothetical protein
MRIINVDESVLRSTDPRRKGWIIKNIENQVTNARRLAHLNIIAGIINKNETFYTVNSGKTNSTSFSFFLIKLCEFLNSQDIHWRKNTVIMIDNA